VKRTTRTYSARARRHREGVDPGPRLTIGQTSTATPSSTHATAEERRRFPGARHRRAESAGILLQERYLHAPLRLRVRAQANDPVRPFGHRPDVPA
jgi:hypothetical protein